MTVYKQDKGAVNVPDIQAYGVAKGSITICMHQLPNLSSNPKVIPVNTLSDKQMGFPECSTDLCSFTYIFAPSAMTNDTCIYLYQYVTKQKQ